MTASAMLADRRPPKAADPPIRLLIVDDSAVARAVLSRIIASQPGFEIVALAGSAQEALDALRTVRVDIVLLDVEMPGASGLEALPEILRVGDGARVLIVSSMCEDGAETAVRALALGAADTLPKPGAGSFAGRFAEVLADRLRRIGRAVRNERSDHDEPSPLLPVRLRAMPDSPLECPAIGASTGGLHALNELFRFLPQRLGAPILITQHLPDLFMPFFARQLEGASGRTARVVREGDALIPDEIHVAPGRAHMELERLGTGVHVRLSSDPVPSGCLPSADPMLASVADIFGASGMAIILSGMGRDGFSGSGRLVASGGAVLAQDRATSVVWGMPRSVAEAGLASAVLPPQDLARRIAVRVEAFSCS